MDPHNRIRMSHQGNLRLTDRGVWLTEDQLVHESAMMSAVTGLQNTSYVFKRGSALALLYRLDRHFTDINFDASAPMDTTDIETTIEHSMKRSDFQISRFIVHKNTEIEQQFKIHYVHPSRS